jgi:hypothetical protein
VQASSAADLEGGLATPAQSREQQSRPSSHKFRPTPLDTSLQGAAARAQPSLLGSLIEQLSTHSTITTMPATSGQACCRPCPPLRGPSCCPSSLLDVLCCFPFHKARSNLLLFHLGVLCQFEVLLTAQDLVQWLEEKDRQSGSIPMGSPKPTTATVLAPYYNSSTPKHQEAAEVHSSRAVCLHLHRFTLSQRCNFVLRRGGCAQQSLHCCVSDMACLCYLTGSPLTGTLRTLSMDM